jgi:hypothetical protein
MICFGQADTWLMFEFRKAHRWEALGGVLDVLLL